MIRDFVETFLDGIARLQEWNRRRKWVTDQEQARLERAEIEAEREARREALRRYVEERQGNPTEEEIQAEVERLRKQSQRGGNEREMHVPGMDGEWEPGFAAQDDSDSPPWMP